MISKEEIEHLKDLARVEFGEAETEKLAKDLGDILGYVEKLKDVDVSSVPEMTHASGDVKNVFRKDGEVTHEGGVIVDAFPEKFDAGHGTYLKVKAILE